MALENLLSGLKRATAKIGLVLFLSGGYAGCGDAINNYYDDDSIAGDNENPCENSVPTGTIYFSGWLGDLVRNMDIFALDVQNKTFENVTNSPEVKESNPSASLDGNLIAFAKDGETYLMNSGGTNQRRLSPYGGLALSFDGTKVVFDSPNVFFSSEPDYNHLEPDVYSFNVNDPENYTNVTNNPARDYEPNWSHDGEQIVFTSRDREGYSKEDVYVINKNGTGSVTNITYNPEIENEDNSAAFSPDGKYVAFRSDGRIRTTDGDITKSLFMANSDGSNPRGLTNTNPGLAPENSTVDRYPSWSPDSCWVACNSMSWGGVYSITVVNIETYEQIRLIEGNETFHITPQDRISWSR